MKPWIRALAAFLLLIVAVFVVFNAPVANDSEAATDEVASTPGDMRQLSARERDRARPAARDRLQRIQQELADLGSHAWAGVYGWDEENGASARLSIAPRSGFAYFRTTPDGAGDVNHGDLVVARPGGVEIRPEIDPVHNAPRVFGGRSIEPLDTKLFPVRWGARLYLISEQEMQAFCNAVNAGREGRSPRFLHRLDAEASAEPRGLPLVPEAYREWLLVEPIQAAIVGHVLPKEQPITRQARPLSARIDAGRARGVRPGMIFWLDEARGYDEAEVLECDGDSAVLRFRLDVRWSREIEVLQVGWRVSTRAPAR